METREFLVHCRIEAQVLETWIEAGWLVPHTHDHSRDFSDVDAARARLIRDLKEDMGVNDEGVGVVLTLLDQMYGLRATLRGCLAAVAAQPEDARRQIIAEIRRLREEGEGR